MQVRGWLLAATLALADWCGGGPVFVAAQTEVERRGSLESISVIPYRVQAGLSGSKAYWKGGAMVNGRVCLCPYSYNKVLCYFPGGSVGKRFTTSDAIPSAGEMSVTPLFTLLLTAIFTSYISCSWVHTPLSP